MNICAEMHKSPKVYGSHIDRTLKVIRQDFARRFKALNLDITPEQWVVIDNLSQKDGQSQTHLAEKCFKDITNLSRIIDLLSNKNLVRRVRNKSDKRSSNIYLTDKGKKVYEESLPTVNDLRLRGWEGLSEKEDFDNFIRILDTIYNNLSANGQ